MPKHLTESVDGSITATHTFTTGTCVVSPTGAFKADVIAECTSGSGITIDSVLLKDNSGTATTFTGTYLVASTAVKADTISEKTDATGVTIDSVLIKDNAVSGTTLTGTTLSGTTGLITSLTGTTISATSGTITNINMTKLSGTTLTSKFISTGTGVTITELSSDGTLIDNSDSAVPTEQAVKTYVDAQVVKPDQVRARFSMGGAGVTDRIKISGAAYMCMDKVAFWSSELTTISQGVHNPLDWAYYYIDWYSMTSGVTLTANEIFITANAPTWNDTYKQWIWDNCRCIFAVRANAGGTAFEDFFHDGGDLVMYGQHEPNNEGSLEPDATWTDMTFDNLVPVYATKLLVSFTGGISAPQHTKMMWYWRTNGSTGTTGHLMATTEINPGYNSWNVNTVPVVTDSNYKIEVRSTEAGDDGTVIGYVNGWYFPGGM